jgi:hypothetical protein
MDELIKVYLYLGQERMDNIAVEKSEFERALDALFMSDSEEVSIRVGTAEIRGITDIIMSGEQATKQEEIDLEEDFDIAA